MRQTPLTGTGTGLVLHTNLKTNKQTNKKSTLKTGERVTARTAALSVTAALAAHNPRDRTRLWSSQCPCDHRCQHEVLSDQEN